jgi:hypothetical protein
MPVQVYDDGRLGEDAWFASSRTLCGIIVPVAYSSYNNSGL